MTGRDDPLALVVQRDVVPIGKISFDLGRAARVVRGEVFKRFIRQNDAPAKGVVGLVPFDDNHVMLRISDLHRNREVETRRPPSQARNSHRRSAPSVLILASSMAQY